jgi:Xaa-Pro dipeptidase
MRIHEIEPLLRTDVLVSDPVMIDYLIGIRFHPGERFLGLLAKPTGSILFLNTLFPVDNPGIELVRFSDDQDVLSLVAQRITGDVLHVDHSLASGFLLGLMQRLPLVSYRVDALMDQLRSIKSADEIAKMREASRVNDSVMAKVPSILVPGITERDVHDQLVAWFDEVSDGISFDPIVAFGDHTADPHAVSGDRALKEGDGVVVDIGCVLNGYCSDMTRTFSIGKNGMEKEYDLVLAANRKAIATVKPGVLLSEIDAAARQVIAAGGYGEAFVHRTGHGIGSSVHEPYPVSASSTVWCVPGMIFSIEPGIYLEGRGGIRIEDLVLVTEEGCEVLNAVPKDQPVLT